jgi:hypothetical protein
VGRRLPLPVNSHREPLSWRVRGAKTMLPPSSRTEIEETREKAANSAANGKKLRTRRMGLRLPSRSRPLMTPINLSARSPRKPIRYERRLQRAFIDIADVELTPHYNDGQVAH